MLETRAKGYDNSDLLTPNGGELANVGEADINEGEEFTLLCSDYTAKRWTMYMYHICCHSDKQDVS